jgi:hypothetical protein
MEAKKVIKPKSGKTRTARQDKTAVSTKAIRKRAYEIYLEREPGEGTPEDDWYRAEEELYSDPGF